MAQLVTDTFGGSQPDAVAQLSLQDISETLHRIVPVSVVGKTWSVGTMQVPGIVTGAAYTSGDLFGTYMILPFPKSGTIMSGTFIDIDNEGINKELWLYNGYGSYVADNAAWGPPDVDQGNLETIVPFSGFYTASGSQASHFAGLGDQFVCPTGFMIGWFVTRGADNIAAGSLPSFSLRIIAD